MEINQLISLVKSKIERNIIFEDMGVVDKTHLHKKHLSHKEGKYHLLLKIKSNELKKYNKIQATKKIYSILKLELKEHIHSIQILIN
mgnify:FL=1